MTRAELVEEIARASKLTRKQSEVIIEAVFSAIGSALTQGEKVEVRGFGSFRVRQRQSRPGRNPRTGEGVTVPERRVPYFKPGKDLRQLINRENATNS
jgi:integration host factor subunit beta